MRVVVHRGAVWSFDALPPKSIALDGFVQGPQIDAKQQRYSFDHHGGCVRHATRATCEQVYDALRLGLDPDGFTVFVNDVDGDTALSVWLLQQHASVLFDGDQSPTVNESLVRSLVRSVGLIDAHGPAYAVGLSNEFFCRAFFEIAMAPEREARKNKTYGTVDLEALLRACVEGIDKLMRSGASRLPPKKEVVMVMRDGTDWCLVSSDDYVFDALYENGIQRAVAFSTLPDGSYAYTVAKKSEFVSDFPVGPASEPGTILHALNEIESGWGGGSTIGGAPRNADGSRSRIPPSELFEIVERIARQSR